jgi:hypothetical protein
MPLSATDFAKRPHLETITVRKMKIQVNASAKSKRVQRYLKADTQVHHIRYCPDTRL